jgi:Heterokaryon incompatibility protein (HET)
VASEASYAQARLWIQDCLSNHNNCPGIYRSPPPARVIDVGDNADAGPRIYECQKGEHQPYAALSYCWGEKERLVLSTSNIYEWCLHGLPYPSLPRTIRDAIVITRKLGLRFVWIDALCIIQDSDLDKSREIERMGAIYQTAHVTIVAASAKDCDDGILCQTIPTDMKQFTVPFLCPDGKLGSLTLEKWQGVSAREPANQFPSMDTARTSALSTSS